MPEPVISTQPPSLHDKKIREKYAETLATQSDLMDKLAQQLITLELAIPGLYATALKLVSGDDATLPLNGALIAAFAAWFVALALTLIALVPRRWRVNPTVIKRDANAPHSPLGIEDFFYQSARYKQTFLIPASLLFFVGIVAAGLSVL